MFGYVVWFFFFVFFYGGRFGYWFGNCDICYYGRFGIGSSCCFLGSFGMCSFFGFVCFFFGMLVGSGFFGFQMFCFFCCVLFFEFVLVFGFDFVGVVFDIGFFFVNFDVYCFVVIYFQCGSGFVLQGDFVWFVGVIVMVVFQVGQQGLFFVICYNLFGIGVWQICVMYLQQQVFYWCVDYLGQFFYCDLCYVFFFLGCDCLFELMGLGGYD